MSEWVETLNRAFSEGHLSTRIIGVFGHSGNFVADSPSTDLEEVTSQLGGLLDTEWVIRPIDDVRAALAVLVNAPEPEHEDGIRWTPGLAFHGRAGIQCGSVATTPRAVLWRISSFAIGVWKRDHLSTAGTLDSDKRAGGWGGVAYDIQAQLGGRWTARSRRTVDGLVRKYRPTQIGTGIA
jgi:hypothetical protein